MTARDGPVLSTRAAVRPAPGPGAPPTGWTPRPRTPVAPRAEYDATAAQDHYRPAGSAFHTLMSSKYPSLELCPECSEPGLGELGRRACRRRPRTRRPDQGDDKLLRGHQLWDCEQPPLRACCAP